MTDGLTDTDIKAVLALTPVECKGNKGNKVYVYWARNYMVVGIFESKHYHYGLVLADAIIQHVGSVSVLF